MIYGPQFNHQANRLQRVGEEADDQHQKDDQQQSQHRGRSWAKKKEKKDLLPVQPLPTSAPSLGEKTSMRVYPDQKNLLKAQELFSHLTTLEEKVSQLCFLETSAVYDALLQHDVELFVQTWQIGGILFKEGNYQRQAYLIERYQEVSKIPLLMVNDFLHGLSFYLQGDSLPKECFSAQRFSDLGKAVMVQNRSLGVHVQLDCERHSQKLPLDDLQAKRFRKGIRDALGIVGKKQLPKKSDSDSHSLQPKVPFLSLQGSQFSPIFSPYQIQEILSYKTLSFFDATHIESLKDERLLTAFKERSEVFLLSPQNITEGIRAICKLIRSGRIREEELDRFVMKILVIKSLFFKQ